MEPQWFVQFTSIICFSVTRKLFKSLPHQRLELDQSINVSPEPVGCDAPAENERCQQGFSLAHSSLIIRGMDVSSERGQGAWILAASF